jgi:hypothetical protein
LAEELIGIRPKETRLGHSTVCSNQKWGKHWVIWKEIDNSLIRRVTWVQLADYSGRVFGCQIQEACRVKITSIMGITEITSIMGITEITSIMGITEIKSIMGITEITSIMGITEITNIPQTGKKGHIRHTKTMMIFLPNATGNLRD